MLYLFLVPTRKPTNKFLCSLLVSIAMGITVSSAAHAGNGHHNGWHKNTHGGGHVNNHSNRHKRHRKHKRNKITIEVNPVTCDVLVRSKRPIRQIQYGSDVAVDYVYDAAGNASPIGKSYVLGQYSDLVGIEDDMVFVKVGNRHYHRRSNGQSLSVDVPVTSACETTTTATCPAEIITIIESLPDFLLGTGTDDLPPGFERLLPITGSNDPLSCNLGDATDIQPGGFSILEDAACNGFVARYQQLATSPAVPVATTICIDTEEEARACAAEIGCDNF